MSDTPLYKLSSHAGKTAPFRAANYPQMPRWFMGIFVRSGPNPENRSSSYPQMPRWFMGIFVRSGPNPEHRQSNYPPMPRWFAGVSAKSMPVPAFRYEDFPVPQMPRWVIGLASGGVSRHLAPIPTNQPIEASLDVIYNPTIKFTNQLSSTLSVDRTKLNYIQFHHGFYHVVNCMDSNLANHTDQVFFFPDSYSQIPRSDNPLIHPPCGGGSGPIRPDYGLIYPRKI